MRVQAAQPALLEALGSQQQVHAEAAPDASDLDEQVGELGPSGQQLAELVHDDEQVRQRRQRLPVRSTPPAASLRWYSRIESRLPARRSSCCRRCCSPCSAAWTRSIIAASSARLVMRPATCGRSVSGANAAPPLKSTSTKLTSSGEWVSASPVTRVRSSSLLPDPVAPTMRPCGPEPPWADSLMSRITGSPSPSLPIGTRSSRSFGDVGPAGGDVDGQRIAAQQHLGQRHGTGEHLVTLVGQAQRGEAAGDEFGLAGA